MKNKVVNAFKIALVTWVTWSAIGHSDARASALPRQDIYGLSKFTINENSTNLPPAFQIASGTMVVNKSTNTLTLHFERNYYCPSNTVCTEQMPEPLIIELPITYIGSGFCGGEVISAETDDRANGGIYVGIHFTNDEGNFCTKPEQDDRGLSKAVTIQFAEQSSTEQKPRLSQFKGQIVRSLVNSQL